MKKIHETLCDRYSWYKNWHLQKHSNFIMWAVFIFTTVLFANTFFIPEIFIPKDLSYVSAASSTVLVTKPGELFTPSVNAKLSPRTLDVLAKQKEDKTVRRTRLIQLNIDRLNKYSPLASKTLTVTLFDGRVLTIDMTKITERGKNNFTWYGKVRGVAEGKAMFSVVNGYLTGQITLLDSSKALEGNYGIVYAGDGSYVLRDLDYNSLKEDEPGHIHAPSKKENPQPSSDAGFLSLTQTSTVPAGASAGTSTTGQIIDLLVVYSNQTAAASPAIDSEIQAAVDYTNEAYANSGVSQRINLVHTEQINYNEGADLPTMLNDITLGVNGAQNVPVLRDAYHADLVSMFIEAGSYCGYGWIGPDRGYGFSVVNRYCATSYASLAHELGHNMGLLHDPATDPGTYPYVYGHGYIDPNCQFRTVMSYPGCGAPRVPYFSNPNILYPGTVSPLGTIDLSNAVRVLNQTAATVASFKSVLDGTCVHANPSISISPSSQSGSSGQSLTFQIKLTNNDPTVCPSSLFTVTPTLPVGFTQSPSSHSVSLAPGGQTTVSAIITSPVSQGIGNYSLTEVVSNSQGSSVYTSSANALYSIVPPDVTPPTIAITSPAQGYILPKKGSGKINVQTDASDASGISSLSIFVDNVLVKSCGAVTTCSYNWTYSKVVTGLHTIKVVGVDKSSAANRSTVSITVTK